MCKVNLDGLFNTSCSLEKQVFNVIFSNLTLISLFILTVGVDIVICKYRPDFVID
jgi:hypothetical protein